MKFLDSIKNALFEVEYVVVPDEPNKPKKDKTEKNTDDVKDKPIAKKVLLSRPKKEEPKEPEVIKPEKNEDTFDTAVEHEKDFKIMNDNDFKVDDSNEYNDNPKVDSLENDDYPMEKPIVHNYNDYDDRRNKYEDNRSYEQPPMRDEYQVPREEDNRVIYREPVRERYSSPYGIDESSRNLVQEYGRSAYEKKEEKSGFKPSPIISPIYGVLDKNYRKEDVVQKKEVRLSSYSKDKVNLDDVRNKALGVHEERVIEKKKPVEVIAEPEIEEDDNLLVDLSKDEDKPSVKEVTMGDAMEYFQDLGLEYNVDYMDASKEKSMPRRVKEDYNDEPEMFPIDDEEPIVERREEPVVEEKSTVVEDDLDNDDNLFDLIENMYQDK